TDQRAVGSAMHEGRLHHKATLYLPLPAHVVVDCIGCPDLIVDSGGLKKGTRCIDLRETACRGSRESRQRRQIVIAGESLRRWADRPARTRSYGRGES